MDSETGGTSALTGREVARRAGRVTNL